MNNLNKIAAALAVLGCSTATVFAQTSSDSSSGSSYMSDSGSDQYSTSQWDNRSWYLTPSINGMAPDHKFNDGHGEGVGLHAGKALSDHWDIQFGGAYSRDKDDNRYYKHDTLGADALYMFSRERLKPFVFAGAGAEYDRLNGPFVDASRTSPYADIGLGLQYQLTPKWAVQADYRRQHAWMRGGSFGFDKANTGLLSVGLSYYFGEPRMAPVAQAAAPTPTPEPVAPAPPPPEPAQPAPHFEHYTLSATELFAFDSAQLRPAQPKLDEIANALEQDTSINNVVITGYTDRIGPDGYNLRLSQRRADAVKSYLVSKGISDTRLTSVGKGKADPVVECHNKRRADLIACLAPNRRVEVEQITIERKVQ